jgi:hypothetical protein
MPMARMNRPMRFFWSAKTCPMRERMTDVRAFAKDPDRVGTGDGVAQTKAKKPHTAQPVAQEEFGLFIAEPVHRFEDQNLEHQQMVKRRPAALRSIGARNRLLQFRVENFEVYRCR